MTTLEMEIALMNHFDIRKNIIVPNVTTLSGLVGFETDLLVLSKSGYATAIEIKVSKSDLKNDLKKKHIERLNTDWKHPFNSKNALEYYYKNLKYFIYAVPEELEYEALKQIPDFCGLLVASEYEHLGEKRISFFNPNSGRGAQIIGNTKWSLEMQLKLARLGTMRILKYKNKCLINKL